MCFRVAKLYISYHERSCVHVCMYAHASTHTNTHTHTHKRLLPTAYGKESPCNHRQQAQGDKVPQGGGNRGGDIVRVDSQVV